MLKPAPCYFYIPLASAAFLPSPALAGGERSVRNRVAAVSARCRGGVGNCAPQKFDCAVLSDDATASPPHVPCS
ncbi:unnamed protein product, partial [Iphiclides podalirius]